MRTVCKYRSNRLAISYHICIVHDQYICAVVHAVLYHCCVQIHILYENVHTHIHS